MSTFLIRVDFHEKLQDHPDYVTLQEFLEKAGYSPSLSGDNGAAYRLPPGQYRLDAFTTGAAVRTAVKTMADQVDANNAVLVVEYADAWWIGLKPA
jgi:hypothetical protein